MRILRTLDEARAADISRSVATLGVFDGVHVGHRHVIRQTLNLAAQHAAASIVITFVRHPRAIIAGAAPKLITPIEERLGLFEELGVDYALALTFDEELRTTPAARFAHDVFEEALRARVVVLGHNCRFGQNREGGADFLQKNAADYPFETLHAEEVRLGSDIVSSTNIRAAISEGDLPRAARMLGRPFALYGTVVPGHGRGRGIGFPTANIDASQQIRPPRGVYGTEVHLPDGARHPALVNIGIKPTFEAGQEPDETVEVHLLDFEGDLYGQDLRVVFLSHLRAERRFQGADDLIEQIRLDRDAFERFLAGRQDA